MSVYLTFCPYLRGTNTRLSWLATKLGFLLFIQNIKPSRIYHFFIFIWLCVKKLSLGQNLEKKEITLSVLLHFLNFRLFQCGTIIHGSLFKKNNSYENVLNAFVVDHVVLFPYEIHVGTLRATSRGYVRLKSTNPYDHPSINPQYLSTEEDRVELRNAVRLTREIISQQALEPFCGRELEPGTYSEKI